jgi:SNF2 family DNA or RNA helicase
MTIPTFVTSGNLNTSIYIKQKMNRVTQPEGMTTRLFPHQLSSIFRMEELERNKHVIYDPLNDTGVVETKMGIYADESGYGKTLGIIGLVLRDKMEWNDYPHVSETIVTKAGGLVRIRQLTRHEKVNCTLILADTTVANQWVDELNSTPSLRKIIISGKKILNSLDVEQYDVIIVIPSIYNKLIDKYRDMAWKRFIYDEPGHIRVKAMKPVISGFCWLVTATPDLITPLHINCKSSFMKLVVGETYNDFESTFRHLVIKNDPEFIKESFKMPEVKHYYYQCYHPIYNTLKDIAPSVIMEMVAAGNISGAIKTLGGTKTSNLAELIRSSKLEELEIVNAEILSNPSILTVSKKERITKHLLELDSRIKTLFSDVCSICHENLTEPVLEPNCQNLFCGKCLLTWCQTKLSCPLCRQKISMSDLVHIDSVENVNTVDKCNYSSKENTLIDILNSYPGGKFIIFSGDDNTFSNIRNAIKCNDYKYVELDGHMDNSDMAIKEFKTGDAQIIFLNSKRNGSGINLQEATDMIFYHEMSNSHSAQFLSRMLRIGRSEDARVHHLLVAT